MRRILLAGSGERREDCRYHCDCLSAFVRGLGRRHNVAAHCPPHCCAFAPLDRAEQLERASAGGVSALAEVK